MSQEKKSTPDSRGGGFGWNESSPYSYRALDTSELLQMTGFAQQSSGGGADVAYEEEDDDVSPLSACSRTRRKKYGIIIDARDSNVFNGW